MSLSTIRRQVKNAAYNLSDAQIKAREATSNDPWGPSTALMNEIAEITLRPAALGDVLGIIWKRLGDHGKNWRHVYKSLVLLDFLVKNGSMRIVEECRENLCAIETLKDFQRFEHNHDQGLTIREKAKHLVALLGDEVRLQDERRRRLQVRDGARPRDTENSRTTIRTQPTGIGSRIETLPLSEETQLKMALALSLQEAERAVAKSEDVLLQMAFEESRREADRSIIREQPKPAKACDYLEDLLTLQF
ncbi:unnamed protein product, partial [Mesorhabditis spiculigera]